MAMSRKRILIISEGGDLHANAVAYALRRKGHECECFFTPDVPTRLGLSLRVDPGDRTGRFLMRGPGIEDGIEDRADAPYDTIWMRRVGGPVLPEDMHPGDRQVAAWQCENFLAGAFAFLDRDDGSFWVNPLSTDPTAQHKPHQLQRAVRAGLTIAPTLISNDPAEIRAFLREQGGVAAHKLLRTASWTSKEGGREHVYAAYTVPVREEQLPEDDVLRLCPAIFQPVLEKSFEIRVACLGDLCVAARINSQSDERAAMDWRLGQFYVGMEPYDLPPEVAAGCRRLLQELGLVHASIDFIVTPGGEHVFLEVNPQGQFLFLESRAGLPILDMFSEFLAAGTRDFTWREDHDVVRFQEFENHWQDTGRIEAARHAVLQRPLGVLDNAPDDVPDEVPGAA